MKTQLRILALVGMMLLMASSFSLATTRTVPGSFSTIQAAVNASSPFDVIQLVASTTYNETVTINVANLTLQGVDSTSVIQPPSGNGINVTANSVTIQNLKVTGAADNGIYAHNVSNLNITGVTASINGTSAVGSGIYVDGITGTSALTNITASSNQLHGISISDGSNGVVVNGGTFIGNGVSGNTATGGGINIHSVSSSVSNITVKGTINSTWNMNAGIIVYGEAASGSVSSVTIGATGTITLTGNGSGSIGEGVAVAGNVTTVNITAQFNQGSLAHGAGVAVVGTDNVGSHSPSSVTISGSTFSGYGLNTPAITLASSNSSPTYISVNAVTATGNTIGADGFQTEDLVYHKLDNASLGLVTTDASNLYVTTNSGSIQRGVDASTTGQTVNVGTGYYTEAVSLNKAITLAGVDTSAKDHPTSGSGITVSANGATIKNLVVDSSLTDGISASSVTGLTLWGVVSRNNSGSGAQLSSCGPVTVTNGSYSDNTHEGINAVGGSAYTINGTTASFNGSNSNQNGGSGIDLVNLSGAWVTSVTASHNYHHGISISNGTSNVHVVAGAYTWNGIAGNAATGGGVNVLADSNSNATTSNVSVRGTVNASNNTTAGIYIFSSKTGTNQINSVTVGDSTGSAITLNNNGSTGAYSGGAGVVVYGRVSGAQVSNATFTKGTNPGVGLANLGDNTTPGSPSGTQVSNSTFNDYTSAKPAVTLNDGQGDISTVDVTASNNTFTFPVAAKVFLEGPFGTGPTMSFALNTAGSIPLSQPYNSAPFNYAGTEAVGTIPANVVDWILVELRATSGGAAVSRRAVFLKDDGTVLDTDGNPTALFTEVRASGYTISNFIVVKHRNHLAVMSGTSVTLPNETAAYDFTTGEAQAFGSGSPMKSLAGSKFGMYAGDVNEDGYITSDDFAVWLVALAAGTSGYNVSDVNMNGYVTSDDFSVWLVNLGLGASTLVP